MNTKKELTEKLTYEEHKKIDEFLRYWHNEGQKVFDLIRKSHGEKGQVTINMAKAVNLMSGIHHYCEAKSCFDRPFPMEYDSADFNKWQRLYYNIGSWTTQGW